MDPRQAYQSRLDHRRADVVSASVREDRWSNARLVVFLGALALAGSRLGGVAVPWWLWPVPPLAFLWAWARHHHAARDLRRARFAVQYYESGLRRLDDLWAGTGKRGETYADPHHPYALDLDLFGEGSLFERLCTARTSVGEECLARWLCQPADAAEIRVRQEAIRELRDAVDWREELAELAGAANGTLEVHELLRWAAAPPVEFPGKAPAVALALSLLMVAAIGLWLTGHSILVPAAAFALQGIFSRRLRSAVAGIVHDIATPARELEALAKLLAVFERAGWQSAALRELARDLSATGSPPSAEIARLGRLTDLLDSRRNQFFAPIAAMLMWETHLAFRLEAWRRRAGPLVARWMAAVARLEALGSLAAYTFENPSDVFAELVDEKGLFEARALGHPLLPRASCVANDVMLGRATRLLLVSGSNMSGKSTLLRAVGVNAVLALTGAPVRAHSLRLSEMAIGATLRVQDDLRHGASRFYAELLRLRLITELTADSRPVLFLLDEILHGTNSHDRLAGAQAILRGLVRRGAFGAVTTHDLALTQLANDPEVRARNVYFADHLENGRMRFDYRMHEGVISHSNALELMRSVGLDVD